MSARKLPVYGEAQSLARWSSIPRGQPQSLTASAGPKSSLQEQEHQLNEKLPIVAKHKQKTKMSEKVGLTYYLYILLIITPFIGTGLWD